MGWMHVTRLGFFPPISHHARFVSGSTGGALWRGRESTSWRCSRSGWRSERDPLTFSPAGRWVGWPKGH